MCVRILSLIILCTTLSCIRATNFSPHHSLLVDFNSNNKSISLDDLLVLKGGVYEEGNYQRIDFKAAIGGSSSFLGYTYKRDYADSYKGRFKVRCSEEVSKKFSVEEILNWPSTVVNNDIILIAPKICIDLE